MSPNKSKNSPKFTAEEIKRIKRVRPDRKQARYAKYFPLLKKEEK